MKNKTWHKTHDTFSIRVYRRFKIVALIVVFVAVVLGLIVVVVVLVSPRNLTLKFTKNWGSIC